MSLPRHALVAEGFTDDDITTMQLYEPVGCSGCNEGYKGRTGIYQVMPISEDIARIVLGGGNAIQIAEASGASGIPDLRRSALMKAKAGMISLSEMNRVTKD
jgi:type IV pilus assembly protein PilB